MDMSRDRVDHRLPLIKATRIGMITPSSNSVLEPLTQAIVGPLYPDVSVHFQRFRVESIKLDDKALAQFDTERLIEAARLLADANMEVIAWNGTSAGWLGLDADRDLVDAIEADTGAKATTTTLALLDALHAFGASRIGLVTPYLSGVQEKVIRTFAATGIETVAERHLEDAGNFSFALYSSDQIEILAREVAVAKPDAIVVFCTGLRGAPIAAKLEAELGIPVVDSVSVTIWKALALAGVSPAEIIGWGRLFTVLPSFTTLKSGDQSHE